MGPQNVVNEANYVLIIYFVNNMWFVAYHWKDRLLSYLNLLLFIIYVISEQKYFQYSTPTALFWNMLSQSMALDNDKYSRVWNLNYVTILWLTCFDDWFDFYRPFIKNLAPRSLPKIPAFFARGLNPRWLPPSFEKLTFEPEHIESCMNTFFWVIWRWGFWFWHQFDAMTSFWPRNPRWPPSGRVKM